MYKLTFLFLIFATFVSHAAEYGIFSEQELSKNHAIIETGNIERIEKNSNSLVEHIKINSNCYEVNGSLGSWGYSKKAGMIITDISRALKILVIEPDILSINIKVKNISKTSCSSDVSNLVDPNMTLEQLKKQIEDLQLRKR